MKVEYKGTAPVSLTSKWYFCSEETKNQVCKGVSIFQNPLSFEQYVNILKNNIPWRSQTVVLEVETIRFFQTNNTKKD